MGCENNPQLINTKIDFNGFEKKDKQFEQFKVELIKGHDVNKIEREKFAKENIKLSDAIKVVRLAGYKVSRH